MRLFRIVAPKPLPWVPLASSPPAAECRAKITRWLSWHHPSPRRIVGRLTQLAEDPFGPYTKPLQGAAGDRSSRVGGLRIVYTVDRDRRLVEVSDIGPRGQIYRRL